MHCLLFKAFKTCECTYHLNVFNKQALAIINPSVIEQIKSKQDRPRTLNKTKIKFNMALLLKLQAILLLILDTDSILINWELPLH